MDIQREGYHEILILDDVLTGIDVYEYRVLGRLQKYIPLIIISTEYCENTWCIFDRTISLNFYTKV